MDFPRLPVLESVLPRSSPDLEAALSDTVLVAVQHLLKTTGSLLESLFSLGLRPENTFVLGKAYSSNTGVADAIRAKGVSVQAGTLPTRPGGFQHVFGDDIRLLWSTVVARLRKERPARLVVLDDGGTCTAMMPMEVCGFAQVSGVEQTTSGVASGRSLPPIRIVEVATSAAKRILESPMISRAVLSRLPDIEEAGRCGVIGVGSVGSAIVSRLLEHQRMVYVFDRELSRIASSPVARLERSVERVIQNSDVVFGCTGDDVFSAPPTVRWRNGETTLVSCSSEDREFRSLLVRADRSGCLEEWTPTGEALIRGAGTTVRILRGGFPLNFDGTEESVPAREIQLTRALLLGGVLQAVLCGGTRGPTDRRGRMLDSWFQSRVAQAWFDSAPEHQQDFSSEIISGVVSPEWIAEGSGGAVEETSELQSLMEPS